MPTEQTAEKVLLQDSLSQDIVAVVERTTEAEQKLALALAIDEWVNRQIDNDQEIPDFWDECDTSNHLAEYLVQMGWHR